MTDHDRTPEDGARISRRTFVGASALAGVAAAVHGDLHPAAALAASERRAPAAAPETEELSIADVQAGLQSGRFTSRALTERYLERIDAMDRRGPALHAVLQTNPDALDIAAALDAERKAKGPRGPLHGVPVLVKDNLATADRMPTTAGSLALVGSTVPRDAFVIQQLRAAGAIVLGKTNLSEWANFRSTHASSGWTGRGGQCRNAYALDRSPSGSSSGTGAAVAANFCTVGIGTETDGSILAPSSANSLVGIKPTVGLVSRAGIIPISHNQDTAGPMARTVRDAAILLGAIAGADPRDAATAGNAGHVEADYTRFLDAAGLKGARIGVARKEYTGYSPKTDALLDEALAVMKDAGAVIVDPADIETAGKFGDSEWDALLYDFKHDLNAYLADLGPSSPAKTLADLIAFNERHRAQEMPYFGQELFEQAQAKGPLTEDAYRQAVEKNRRMSRAEGIDATMDRYRLDALVAPTMGPAPLIDLVNGDPGGGGSSTSPAAVAGYPSVTVPCGYVLGVPVGLSFFGRAYTEGALLRLAYAYEQASRKRVPPRYLPTAVLD
ncbi:MAG: amidase [Gemmatimonadota bacterium]|nr:amidase [Gemmatimonadota bacterium]